MELLQLRYFYDSAQNESFTKTAEKYMTPVSSVSASVKRLEKELKCELFDRTSNKITLNQNGQRLQQSLCLIFDELNKTVEELSVPKTDNREIRILIKAIRSKITDYIIEYNKKYPHIFFKTVSDYGKIDSNGFDIIIDEETSAYSDFNGFELTNMNIFMNVSKDHSLCGKKLTLKQLSNQSFVSLGENSNMHKLLVEACKKAGFVPNIVAQINDMKCFEKMIESGIGIGLGRKSDENAKITALNVSDFDKKYVVYAYYKDHEYYGNIKHFLDYLKNRVDNSKIYSDN